MSSKKEAAGTSAAAEVQPTKAPAAKRKTSVEKPPCEFDWIRTPRAARTRHKFIGPVPKSEPSPRIKPKKKVNKRKMYNALRNLVEKDRKLRNRRRGRIESPPLSPCYLGVTKRRDIENWLMNQGVIDSTSLEPFEGWIFVEPENKENGTKQD